MEALRLSIQKMDIHDVVSEVAGRAAKIFSFAAESWQNHTFVDLPAHTDYL